MKKIEISVFNNTQHKEIKMIMKPKNIPGVPQQIKGSFHDTESKIEIKKTEDADFKFETLKERLMDINNWKAYCSESNTDFKLCDSLGHVVYRIPQIGDYIKIDIPGPGEKAGKSFDWVQIVIIDVEVKNRVMIQCRPSRCPQKESSRKIAHFYSSLATSTFIISREKNYLQVGIYGRNECPNLKSGLVDGFRNILVAIGGMLGFSKIQWKCLADGMVNFNKFNSID